MPAGPGVRVDTAIEAGERVPPDYDPLIAKIMVHAADRPAAIARLRRALDEVEVGGIQTTLPFDRFVARHPTFSAGDLSTGWVGEHWDGPAERAAAVRSALVAAGLAALEEPAMLPARSPAGSLAPASGQAASPDGRSAWRVEGRHVVADRWPR